MFCSFQLVVCAFVIVVIFPFFTSSITCCFRRGKSLFLKYGINFFSPTLLSFSSIIRSNSRCLYSKVSTLVFCVSPFFSKDGHNNFNSFCFRISDIVLHLSVCVFFQMTSAQYICRSMETAFYCIFECKFFVCTYCQTGNFVVCQVIGDIMKK